MSILVTGAAGFLGRAVVESLLSHGDCDLKCFVRPCSNLSGLEHLRARYPRARINYVVGNLASAGTASAAVDEVDTVYHLAAGMRGLPATIFRDTVVASNCLLNAMRGKKRRVVLVSSIGVYGTARVKKTLLISENSELDPHPEKRNAYFHAKIWQEQLFRERADRGEIDLTVVRPGVLYGQGDPNHGLPSRVGMAIGSVLVTLGGSGPLPLSHVANCAEAVVMAGRSQEASGRSYNVIDDDLPTTREYLRHYKRYVKDVKTIWLPLPITILLSNILQRYHLHTRGQVPAVLTPYQARAMYMGHRFDNQNIKSLGWKQARPTDEMITKTFALLHEEMAR
jgi:nucleoside-diphosphate-sugar epimerase